MKDVYGQALLDFQLHGGTPEIITNTSVAGEDSMEISYFFRPYKDMPKLEKKALSLCKGKILDIGCGAGSHSLYLQEKGFDVTSIDISPGAIEVCKARGVKNTIQSNILDITPTPTYDTILILMNGAGICGKLKNLAQLLNHLSGFLNEGGQILTDSSDIIYMYEDENGEHWIDSSIEYYGETTFSIAHKNEVSDTFNWLYVDYNTLQRCANYNHLNCELIEEGAHYDYLAKITKQ